MLNDVGKCEGYYTREFHEPVAGNRGGNSHGFFVFSFMQLCRLDTLLLRDSP